MANLNKVMLIGRLTRDPEVRMFSNGGKVAKFGFAVNNRKRNQQTNQWEDEPVFLDCEAFNRGDQGTLASRIEETLRKGQQIFIEGHLKLDQWEKDGQKHQKIKVVVDNFQYLEPKGGGDYAGGGGGGGYAGGARSANSGGGGGSMNRRPGPQDFGPDESEHDLPRSSGGGGGGNPPAEDDIPF